MARRDPVLSVLRRAAPLAALMLAGSGYHGGSFAEAFLPWFGPKAFEKGARLPLYVNEMISTKKPLPLDHYKVGYCSNDNIKARPETLGAYLEGDREETSLYVLEVNSNTYCNILCEKMLNTNERYTFSNIITHGYQVHMTVDDLPALFDRTRGHGPAAYSPSASVQDQPEPYMMGFPVGLMTDDGSTYLYNHLRIDVALNPVDSEKTKFNVVGFMVEPFSVKHRFSGSRLETCDLDGYKEQRQDDYLSTDDEEPVVFTYDVIWTMTDMPWTQRWDIYVPPGDQQIHWFSITNSSVIVLFLTVLVAMIMIRALGRDIQRYNAEDIEEASEETGWKLVHGDVMRPPTTYPMLFAVCVGTGVHLWTVCFLVLCFSIAHLVSPLRKGGMLTVSILIYVLTSSLAGYNAARIHRRFRGTEWLKMTFATAVGFPGMSGIIFLFLNLQEWAVGSTGAVPFRILVQLFAMWLLVQTPLVMLGSYYGFKKELPPQVVRTNQIPRMIPQTPWYVDPKVAVPFAGVLPFGALLVELVCVMSALWTERLYFIFGFLLLVMIILTITCAEISIVMCYFQLCSEDYRWWWRSLFWSGSCAGWMFIYSVGYFFTTLDIEGFVPTCLFFGYTLILTGSFFLMTGAVGYFSCQRFIDIIYGSIKVD